MDIGKAMSFIREDPRWKDKFFPGAVINSVFVANFAAWGYMLETLLNVAGGQELPMAEWTNFSGNWLRGFYLFLIRLIYNIVTVLLFCCGGVMFFLYFSATLGLGFQRETQQLATTLGVLMPILLFCASCLFVLYAIALWILEPAIVIQYATTGQVGSAFRFSEMFRMMTSNLGNYAIAVIVPWIIPVLVMIPVACIYFILTIIPVIGVFFAICLNVLIGVGAILFFFYLEMVRAHLYGQLLRGAQMPASAPMATLPLA